MEDHEAHCFRCNKAVQPKDTKVITAQSKAKILKGVCSNCDARVSRFLKEKKDHK